MPVEPDTGRPLAVEGTPLRVETAEVGVSVALPLAAVVGDGVPLTVGDGVVETLVPKAVVGVGEVP